MSITVSMDTAARLVDAARKAVAGPCDGCERCAMVEDGAISQFVRMATDGWEMDPARAAYFRRCDACKVPRFPWAKRLDVERVHNWLSKRENPDHVFNISEMEHLVNNP